VMHDVNYCRACVVKRPFKAY